MALRSAQAWIVKHHVFERLTLALLLATLVALIMALVRPAYAPAAQCLWVLAAIASVFVQPWSTRWEVRGQLLNALVHELYVNLRVLDDPKFKPDSKSSEQAIPIVYPRLFSSCLEATMASGAFCRARDRRLFKLMHQWRECASDLNNRLGLIEMLTFTNPSTEVLAALREKLTTGATIAGAKRVLSELCSRVVDVYGVESGVGRDTVLFPEGTQDSI